MKKFLIVSCLLLSMLCGAQSLEDVRYSPEDVVNFNEVMELLTPVKDAPVSELVIMTAKHFLGTDYVSFTLELEPEMLTVSTTRTDCILFVEMCLAMSLTAKEDSPDFGKYCDNLRKLRYRDGVVDGYASRVHYTSEWIHQGEARGLFEEITKDLGGVPYDQKFFYMSTHPDFYKQLKDNPRETARIKAVEKDLEKFDYYLMPKDRLEEMVDGIETGDIVCFNERTPGIDIAHVAYAYRDGDKLTFIHASSTTKKVVINSTPLVEYTRGINAHNGLRIVRLK